MTFARSFSVHGRTFELRAASSETLEAVRRRWAALEVAIVGGGAPRVIDIEAMSGLGADRLASNAFLLEVARALYPDLVLVHAALVLGRDGGAAVVAGGSGAGKSTIAALARACGLAAPADDVVSIDRAGRAYAWPFASEIRDATRAFLDELGLGAEPAPAPSAVLEPRRIAAVHVLDRGPTATAGLFATSFNAWCASPAGFLAEVAARLEATPVTRHEPLSLDTDDGRSRARATARAILAPLGAEIVRR